MSRLAVIGIVLSAGMSLAADAVDMLKFVPPQANTVAVVNVAGLLASPRAAKEGWAKLEHTEYLAGAVPLNPLVNRMVLAKELDTHNFAAGSVLALMDTTRPVVLDKVAAMVGGQATTAGDDPALVTPQGTYFVKLEESMLGAVRTDSKQDVARWLRFAKASKESHLHKSLVAAAARSSSHHITLAVDVEDMFEAAQAVAVVANTKSIANDPVQVKLVEKLIVGLKAVVFNATITGDGIQAVVRLESKSVDPKLNPDFAKAFVIETLSHSGAALEDLGTAKGTLGDNVMLAFKMSDPELARVMSLVLPPGALPPNAETIPVTPAGPTAAATLKYFKAVNAILDDLQKQKAKALENGMDYEKTAVWVDTAASKIESLSVIGVDQDVVAYGQGTAERLRMVADSLSGVPAKVDELQGQAYAFGTGNSRMMLTRRGFRFNPWGGANSLQTNLGEIRNKQAKVIKDDQANREKLWASIDGKRSETRAGIASKYGVVPPEKK
jgi:hypothetical protein